MWLLKRIPAAFTFVLLLVGILWLPEDVSNPEDALEGWRRVLAMIDREMALLLLAVIAIAYIVWMDVRPLLRDRQRWGLSFDKMSVSPDDLTYVVECKDDGIHLAPVVHLRNPLLTPTFISVLSWRCEIAGKLPAHTGELQVSPQLFAGQKLKITLPNFILNKVDRSVSGNLRMTILFGPNPERPSSACYFEISFVFDTLDTIPKHQFRLADYLEHRLLKCEYGGRVFIERLRDRQKLAQD